jgi:beta-galactosidase
MKTNKLMLLAAAAILLLCRPVWAGKNDSMYQEQPAATSAITFDGRGFIINGQRTFVASGDIHYPRVPQALWHDRLLRLKRSGLNCVQTYVFMDYHSPQEGVYDFSGEKDFGLYLRDIHDLGLYCTVRPGMYVCSEWDNGGYPEWLLLKPGLGLRITEAQFLAAHDSWYGQIMPVISTNQINRNGPVILVQLDNEHPSCWGVDTANQPYFTHLRTNALAHGLEVPSFFSGLHHAHAPAGTTPFDSVGRTSPWYSTEFWAGWFNLYGGTISLANTYDRDTWQIIAYGGNGYNYYMFHGGGNFDHWNANGIGASYDYGAALGQCGDFRPLYYRDKRAALFARSFQAILENSTNASSTYAGAAGGVSAISARGSPSGTILFLDNNTSGNSTAVLNNGAQMTLEAGEIAPVVKNFAMTKWLAIAEADARIFGIQPQGGLTTLVLYGLAGETVRVGFSLTTGSATYADPAFAVNATNVTFSAPIANGTPVSYQLVAGTNSLRVLVMTKNAVDRTWFVDSAGTNYVVSGPAYVGEFTNASGQIICSLEEPVGSVLTNSLLVYDGIQFAPRALTVTNQINTNSLTAPSLVNWQMRTFADPAAASYDDSAWFTTNTAPLMGADGDASHYAWYRASVTVSNAGTYLLNFTGIQDWATLFVNGQQVPMTVSTSAFSVSAALQAGTNTLAIFTSQVGRDSLYSVTGTSVNGFTPRGLLGLVGLSTSASASVSLTNWYWQTIGSSAPSASDIATATATNFDPVAAGWSTGSGWNANVFSGAGYAWFRTVLPAVAGASHLIHFTNVDDNCTVYLNGTNVVATHTGWGQPFDVSLDACWQTNGPNVLTVLVQNTGGGGGLNGTVILNGVNPAAPIPTWKLKGGVGPIDGTNVTWQSLASANGLPVFYRATFSCSQPAGVLPILRCGWSGLSYGFVWLNGHMLGRYPETIPVSSIYLPECWIGPGATNELVIFEEQGKAPGSVALTVETGTSRQLLQCATSTSVPTNILAPASLNASPGNGRIALTWAASVGATNYVIWRGFSSGNESNSVGATIGTTYTDTGLTNGTTYFYVVTAAGPGGLVSSNSPEASATPVAPTSLSAPASLNASPDNGQIALAWTASTGATNYVIWRSLSSGNESNSVGATIGTTYTDTGLINGTTYFYVVTAAGPGGLVSSNSPEASATPSAPAGVLAPASLNAYPGNSQITLTWSASVGATNYVIWRALMSGGEVDAVATNSSTTYTDTGLVNGTTYYYVVTAAGPGGVSGNSPEAGATPAAAVSGTWTADASGNWSDSNNWFGGNVADGDGNTADFSTINLTADRTITLDAPHTISTLKFGDTAPDHNWTLAGANTLTLGTAPVINVANQTATISAVIAGTAGLTKTGLGTLTLGGATDAYTGGTKVNAGTLALDFTASGSPTTSIISTGNLLTLGGGTVSLVGAASGTNAQAVNGLTLNQGSSAIAVASGISGTASLALGAITRNNTSTLTLTLPATGNVTTTSGTSGQVLVGGTGNDPYVFVTDSSGNLMDFGARDASGNIGSGASLAAAQYTTTSGNYSLNSGGTIADVASGSGITWSSGNTWSGIRFNAAGAWAMTGSSSGKNLGLGVILVTTNVGANNVTISGSAGIDQGSGSAKDVIFAQDNIYGEILWTGIGNFRNNATGHFIKLGRGTVNCSNGGNGFHGQTDVNGGVYAVANNGIIGDPGTAAAVNLNGGTLMGTASFAMDNAGANPRPVNLLGTGGGLAAQSGATLTVDGVIAGAAGTGPLTIGLPASSASQNTAGLLPGTGGGTANAAVNATGTVLLSGANTYTGNTLIASGTLLVNNAAGSGTGSGAVVVNSGGTLGGNGIISGAVNVCSGGAFAPGNPLGALTIGNNLTLAAGSTTFVQVQHSPLTNGAVKISGAFSEGGTLIVTNTGGAAFTAGDSFQLFGAASYAGSFAGFVLPPLTGKLVWNTNALKNSGVLSVVTLTSPAIAAIQITGGNLVISGSGGVNSWPFVLLASTNLAAQWAPIETNQFTAGGSFILTNVINQDWPQTFYRLQLL